MWSSSWHSASKKSVIYLFNFQYCGIYVGEKKKPDTVVALHSLFSRGTGFSWLPSFLQTAALTGAKNKKERGQTPLIVCYFQSYGDIMWATFCISSLKWKGTSGLWCSPMIWGQQGIWSNFAPQKALKDAVSQRGDPNVHILRSEREDSDSLGSVQSWPRQGNVGFTLESMWYVSPFNQNKHSHAKQTLAETLNLLSTHMWNMQQESGCWAGLKRDKAPSQD